MSFSPDVIDHAALGQSRILQQFRESGNFTAFLTGILSLSNQIEAGYQEMLYMASIDDMSGANLDTIGVIVGISRNVSGVVTLTWFGFEDTGAWATCFGEESDQSIGSRFFEEGEIYASTTILQDVEYRLLLKSKVAKNNSSSTPEDIIQSLRLIFGVEDIKLTENAGDKSISIAIGRPILAFEQALITALDILPRPAGIRISGPVTSYVPPGDGYTGGTEGENF
jgi:hypothetical protein